MVSFSIEIDCDLLERTVQSGRAYDSVDCELERERVLNCIRNELCQLIFEKIYLPSKLTLR